MTFLNIERVGRDQASRKAPDTEDEDVLHGDHSGGCGCDCGCIRVIWLISLCRRRVLVTVFVWFELQCSVYLSPRVESA